MPQPHPPLRPSLATHYRRYAIGNVLTLAAGFVSFPVTTRLLSSEQFGILGYWEAWILLLTAVLKLGAGDPMMRFYPAGGDQQQLARHSTNFLLVPALMGAAGWMFAMMLVWFGSASGFVDTPAIAFAAMSLVLLQVVISHVLWAMRTRELSGAGVLVEVTWRWLGVAAVVVTLVYVTQSLLGLFVARVMVAAIVAAWLLRWTLQNLQFSRLALDWRFAREGLAYGLPLAMMELSSIVLTFIDRIMLKWLLNDYAALGIFVIGSSLANYVAQLATSALAQAWLPAANRIYNTQGPNAIRSAKQRLLRPLTYVCVGLAVAVIVGGRDLVTLIAGVGKVDAAPIFITAAVCLTLIPVLSIAGTGLLLERRSKTLFALTLAAASFNFLVNLVAIPQFGILGATFSTCASQVLLQVLVYRFCSPALRSLPDVSVVGRALLAALTCLALAAGADTLALQLPIWRLCVLVPVLGLGYVLPAMAMDRELRNLILGRTSLGL